MEAQFVKKMPRALYLEVQFVEKMLRAVDLEGDSVEQIPGALDLFPKQCLQSLKGFWRIYELEPARLQVDEKCC